ncbi:MAG: hypothetical protein ACI97A_002259 [Planctomycetota bacterium]|jgi:hypothetical protein
MLWFPFSVPATVLGMVTCLTFYLVNLTCAYFVDGLDSAGQAIILFGRQLVDLLTTLRINLDLAGGAALFSFQLVTLLALWATIGLAICRCIALRLCRDEYIGLRDAFSFGLTHAKTTALFPVIVFASLTVLAVVNFLIGSLMQIPFVGVVFYLLLPIAFIMTALMLIIAFTSLLGAGMVSGAVAVEQRGTLDAWGKALNYIFARPLHVIIYMVLMNVFLKDIVWHYAFETQILRSWTFASLSPLWENVPFMDALRGTNFSEEVSTVGSFIAKAVVAFVNLAIAGFVTSFVFAGTTAMFLILRRDVDGIDVADIKQK